MSAELRTRIEAGELGFLDGLVLLGTIASQRWFGGKSRDVLDARVLDAGVVPGGPPLLAFGVVEVRYGLQSHDLYHLPLGFRPAAEAWPESVIAELDGWTVYDAIADDALVREIVGLMRGRTTLRLEDAAISFWGAEGLSERSGELTDIRPMGVEQSNSSIVIGDALALKLYRRIEPGVNPELELLRFLSERRFEHVPALEGYAAYEGRPLEATLAILQRFVPSYGDGWKLALELMADDPEWLPEPEQPSGEALALLSASIDEEIEGVFATLPDDERIAPIAGHGEEVRERLRALTHIGNVGKVIRHHGDYHLGQALRTHDDDWLILDFEGEPARSVQERRRKRSPLRDVAGMLRSFAYAASAAELQRGVTPPADWEAACRRRFLEGYLAVAEPSLLPGGEQAIMRLLTVFELEKAVYELRYELGNRPDWVGIPVAGIQRMLEQ